MQVSEGQRELGEIIREIRDDLTRYRFAIQIDVTPGAVIQWEQGTVGVSLNSAVKLINYAKEQGKDELAQEFINAIGLGEVVA